MPSEFRCILFSWREIREALVGFQRRRGVPVPMREPDAFVVDPGKLSIELTYEDVPEPQVFRFDRGTLTAALILHCKDRGVRLPLKSKKLVHLIDTRLALMVHIAGGESEEFLAFELATRVA
jgi:hypothetical protein